MQWFWPCLLNHCNMILWPGNLWSKFKQCEGLEDHHTNSNILASPDSCLLHWPNHLEWWTLKVKSHRFMGWPHTLSFSSQALSVLSVTSHNHSITPSPPFSYLKWKAVQLTPAHTSSQLMWIPDPQSTNHLPLIPINRGQVRTLSTNDERGFLNNPEYYQREKK